jgi:hypothetical protein
MFSEVFVNKKQKHFISLSFFFVATATCYRPRFLDSKRKVVSTCRLTSIEEPFSYWIEMSSSFCFLSNEWHCNYI